MSLKSSRLNLRVLVRNAWARGSAASCFRVAPLTVSRISWLKPTIRPPGSTLTWYSSFSRGLYQRTLHIQMEAHSLVIALASSSPSDRSRKICSIEWLSKTCALW